jgi:threonine dehydrogenase-like Zn-dependent dehydrogenase
MRQAVWDREGGFRIEERATPEPGEGQVRIRVGACGVCMTEVHGVEGLLGEAALRQMLGHEFGGVVDAAGPGVVSPPPGTPVACAGRGGYAEQVVLGAAQVCPLPPGLPVELAAFAEPVGCCVAAVERAGLALGAAVLLTGAGPMGLLTLQLARRGGAARVLVSEPDAARRDLARRLGAAEAIDPSGTSVEEAVARCTEGRGADAAFECAGRAGALADCLGAVRPGGTVVMVGVNPAAARLELDLYPFHRREVTLIGSYGGAGRGGFRGAVSWLGQIDLAPLISHRFDLAEIERAFETARSGRCLKVLVGPGLA